MSISQPERPGIYINETLAPLAGNPGVPGTAVATFAANYNRGPTSPTFVSSWNQYQQIYGTFAQANGNLLHYAVYQYFNNGGNGCYVLAVPNSDATTATLVLQDTNSPADNVLTVSAISPGAWGNQLYVAIITAGNPGRFDFQVYMGGTGTNNMVEQFIDLSINPADPRNVVGIVNSSLGGSNYVTVTSTLPAVYVPGVNDPALITPTVLSGGGDGVTAQNLGTVVPTYLDQLQGTMLNLNVPGLTNISTINTLISWAAGRGDVMIVVDGPSPSFPETSATVAQNYINMVTGGSPITNSSYASLYAPWIQISNPASTIPGSVVWVPPGGAVLGVWSRTDNEQGPWQTPAGISFGKINLVNLEVNFTATDLNNLNINNVNAIRFVPGYFPAIMGGRTLAQGYPTRYIAVRRMLTQLEHDFTTLLQFALFEPNDINLWNQISNTLTNYLNGLMQQGVLGGSTPDQSFTVVCDTSNNTPATSAAGLVNASVAVAVNSPAEFIVINITQFQNTGTTTISTQQGLT